MSGRSVKKPKQVKSLWNKYFNYCFEIDTNITSRLLKLIRLSVAYTRTYDKENKRKVHFGNFPFNFLEVEQIKKKWSK